jgi:hypothetical protein
MTGSLKFKTPHSTIQKMNKLTYPELKELAQQAGNLEAFVLLKEKKDIEKASELLNIEQEFQHYLTIVRDKSGQLHEKSLQYLNQYRNFLMAKICFPEDFEETGPITTTQRSKSNEPEVSIPSTGIDIPINIKHRLLQMTNGHLKKLALQSGNLKAFEALEKGEGADVVSRLLGHEKEYEKYILKFKSKVGESPKEASDLLIAFNQFLMAKICFPSEF